MNKKYYYHNNKCPEFKLIKNSINTKELEEYKQILKKRPNAYTELPPQIAEVGTMQFEFQLDFGSFRDIQRHRAVTQRMPLLTTKLGFEQ
jgi:hypothetical protein